MGASGPGEGLGRVFRRGGFEEGALTPIDKNKKFLKIFGNDNPTHKKQKIPKIFLENFWKSTEVPFELLFELLLTL